MNMSRTVVLVGTLDTKGEDLLYVKHLIEGEGLSTLMIDFGVMGEAKFQPDIGRAEVAAAGRGDLKGMRSGDHKDEAMESMSPMLGIKRARFRIANAILSMSSRPSGRFPRRPVRIDNKLFGRAFVEVLVSLRGVL